MKRPSSLSSRQQVRMSVPSNSEWLPIQKTQQQIFNFPYSLYPFPNHPVTIDFFNTIIDCNINQQKIDRIVNLKCQNLIALKKIAKIKKKDCKSFQVNGIDQSNIVASSYSFYYQKVQYSLGYILQLKKKQNIVFNNKFNLDRAQIKKTLASVIASLYKQGITSFLDFSQIGINEKGVIKVYVAPNVLFARYDFNPKTKILMLNCLKNVLKEIDVKFPKSLHNKHSIQSFKLKPQTSLQKDIIESQPSFFMEREPHSSLVVNNYGHFKDKKKNIYVHEEGSFAQEQQNFIEISESTNLDHFKLKSKRPMNKNNRHPKMSFKLQQSIQDQKKSKILKKLQQKQKIDELTLQLQHMRQKIKQKIQQKRQKNIFSSKIFKTLPTQDHTHTRQKNSAQKYYKNVFAEQSQKPIFQPVKRSKFQKKRKSSQSSINFYQGVISQQKNINCINIYNPKNFPQKSYYQLMGDDGMSVDTYQLEIGDDYQMPQLGVPIAMRSSMSPIKIGQIGKNISQSNQQQNGEKSRFSESAGGKSYGSILNLLKHKFAPKKSNIFEEPQNQNDEDSKHSMSFKKSIGKQHSDRFPIEKCMQNNIKSRNIQNPMNPMQSEETQIKGLKTVEQFRNDLKNIMHMSSKTPATYGDIDENDNKFQNRLTLPISRSNNRNPQMDLMFLRQTEYRPKTNHKISDILIKKCALQEKVKKAMQRTKKAINVLESAKIRQSGSLNTLKGAFILD